jgi:hypothetical protein
LTSIAAPALPSVPSPSLSVGSGMACTSVMMVARRAN